MNKIDKENGQKRLLTIDAAGERRGKRRSWGTAAAVAAIVILIIIDFVN